jgi:hypothetical protein
MAINNREPGSPTTTQRNLLKYQTIYSNLGIGMNDNTVRVRNYQTAANLTIERDVCAGNDTPKTMPQDQTLTNDARNDSSPLMPILITPDGKKQFSTRVPELSRPFTAPVGDLRANQRSVVGAIVYDIHSQSDFLVSVSSHP